MQDLSSGVVTLGSADASGVAGSKDSFTPHLTADGDWLMFDSSAENWTVSRGVNGAGRDVFAKRLLPDLLNAGFESP